MLTAALFSKIGCVRHTPWCRIRELKICCDANQNPGIAHTDDDYNHYHKLNVMRYLLHRMAYPFLRRIIFDSR